MIVMILTKFKIFIYGAIAWAVLQYFEYQSGHIKFNLGRFLISSCIFWILTEFSHLMIDWDLVMESVDNESRLIVISIMLAAFLYLFIPFVLRPENRGRFVEWVLAKFWFYKNK